MNAAYSFRSYKIIAAQTAPPGQLVVMLHDGAIRFLERALAGFQHDDPKEFNETTNNNVLRAQEIISELDGSLDLAQGGELAATLRRLYNFMDNQLTHSNASKSPEGIRDALQRLSTLRDAWRGMLAQRGSAQREPASYAPLAMTS
jgi:flagellar protein FliS